MSGTKCLFTREMGSWLRELQEKAGLRQDDVASRMGMRGKGRSNQMSALEIGRIKHPYFETIIFYMLAFGTPVGRFCDRFNALGLVEVDSGILDRVAQVV